MANNSVPFHYLFLSLYIIGIEESSDFSVVSKLLPYWQIWLYKYFLMATKWLNKIRILFFFHQNVYLSFLLHSDWLREKSFFVFVFFCLLMDKGHFLGPSGLLLLETTRHWQPVAYMIPDLLRVRELATIQMDKLWFWILDRTFSVLF